MLLQLGCFVGGCTLDVAELLGADEALDDVATLVESSLVSRDGPRYRLLETVHEFSSGGRAGHRPRRRAHGAVHLVGDELRARARGRCHRSQRIGGACHNGGQEYANLREALQRLLARDDGASAHRLAASPDRLLGRAVADRRSEAIDRVDPGHGWSPSRPTGDVAQLAHLFCTLQNDLAAAMRHALESLAV